VSFLKNVLEWEALSLGDREQAERMYELYIKEGAPMQINISWHARTDIERRLAELGPDQLVPEDIFEAASTEVARMMVVGGIWGSFVWLGGCDYSGSNGGSSETEANMDGSTAQVFEKVQQLALA